MPEATPATETLATWGLSIKTDTLEVAYTPLRSLQHQLGTLFLFPRMPGYIVSSTGHIIPRQPPWHTTSLQLVLLYNTPFLPTPIFSDVQQHWTLRIFGTLFIFGPHLLCPTVDGYPRLCSNHFLFQNLVTLTRLLAWGAGGQCPGHRFHYRRFTRLSSTTVNNFPFSIPSQNTFPC